jgi:hypothetical protein
MDYLNYPAGDAERLSSPGCIGKRSAADAAPVQLMVGRLTAF